MGIETLARGQWLESAGFLSQTPTQRLALVPAQQKVAKALKAFAIYLFDG